MQSKVHGLRAVKLTEIPLDQRLTAARQEAKSLCRDGDESVAVLIAALFPSDKTYWVRAQAAELLAA